MKAHGKLVSLLLVLCLLLGISGNAFAKSYIGSDVIPGLSDIQPDDSLTLPGNTIWATLTAMWGVDVIFQDWDETELKRGTVAVSDAKAGSFEAPKNPTKDGWTFTGWERVDQNGDTNVLLGNDGKVKNITGPGPIIYRAMYVSSVPKTGDNSNMMLWFNLMGISVLGIVISNKKHRKAAYMRDRY